MKKIAIISDIHGNLEALETVLFDIEKQDVQDVYCLGDIVGYGPYPKKCLDIIRKKATIIVTGNHELGVLRHVSFSDFRSVARAGIEFSRRQLSKSDLIFLQSLQVVKIVKNLDLTLIHGSFTGIGSPNGLQVWGRIRDMEDAMYELEHSPTRLCFVGHIHVPFVIDDSGKWYEGLTEDVVLKKDKKYLINVGSVGQPRDKNPMACYGILSIGEGKTIFKIQRVLYDIQKTVDAIYIAGLPEYLGNRLLKGE